MPENGFMTPAETRAEYLAAEAALLARRSPAELAGEMTGEEIAANAASDAALAEAVAAHAAADAALFAANAATDGWREPTGREAGRIAEAERTVRTAAAAEAEARLDWSALQTRIGQARQARRNEAER
jgi:hypothetical protein